ncbi:MAG: VWA domain-containing protein [Saprospiraceae bacterium]
MISIGQFQLAQPWWLLGLMIIPMLWYWKKRKYGLKMQALKYSVDYSNLTLSTWKTMFFPYVDLIFYFGLISFVFALSRPQRILTEEKVRADGVDIIMAMDLSSSMLSRDFNPDRLEVSKMVAKEFVDKRKYDRIGLVVFSGESYTQAPLTTDHVLIQDFLSNLTVGVLEDGTAIGMGLANAVNRLKDSQAKSRIIILLTDGENNAGYIDPMTSAEIAKAYGIKVYTIAIGSRGTALSPISRTGNGEYLFGMRQVTIDEDLLQQISNFTNGKFFRAIDRAGLEQIYSEIDTLEKTKIEITVFKRYKDYFKYFIALGILLFLGWWILKQTIFSLYNVD